MVPRAARSPLIITNTCNISEITKADDLLLQSIWRQIDQHWRQRLFGRRNGRDHRRPRLPALADLSLVSAEEMPSRQLEQAAELDLNDVISHRALDKVRDP